MSSILLALANAFAGAFGNIAGARATASAATSSVLMVTAATSLTAASVVALLAGGSVTAGELALGFVAGLVGACGLPLCYRAFAAGPVGVVSPVLSCTTTVTVVTGAWIGTGRLGLATVVGLGLCLVAVLVATLDRGGATRSGALLAFGAGASFGAFSLIIAQVPGTHGLWPLVAARIGVVVFALALAAFSALRTGRRIFRLTRGALTWLPVAALSGLAEIGANMLFLLAVFYGDLATVSVVQALSPIASVLVGWAVLRQKPRARHWFAVVIAICALLVIALGSYRGNV